MLDLFVMDRGLDIYGVGTFMIFVISVVMYIDIVVMVIYDFFKFGK